MFGGQPGPAWRFCDHCTEWDAGQRHVWFGPHGQVSMHQFCCAERGCAACRGHLGVKTEVGPTEADLHWLYAHDPVRPVEGAP